MNIAVVLAGGVGSRYGGNLPKQYCMLNGKEVIAYAVEAAKKSKKTDKVLIVCDRSYQERLAMEYGTEVCDGGNTRNISVYNALAYIKERGYDCKKIIFLDSARPLIRAELIDEYMDKLDEYDCVITGQKIVDSLGKVGMRYVDREDYYLIQTPEACNFSLLCSSFDKDSDRTAICQLMPENSSLYVSYAMKNNMKVTYMGDLELVGKFLEEGV